MHNYTFQLQHLQIPFKFSYEHNLSGRSSTDSLLLVLTLNDIVCVGETTPRDYVTGETTSNMPTMVKKYLPKVVHLFDGSLDGLSDSLTVLPPSQNALKCLIESSLLSYLVQQSECTIFQLMNAEKDTTIQYTASITGGSEKSFRQMAMMAAHNQMTALKLKITDSKTMNLSRVNFLKEVCGNFSVIRMDGNEIWTFEQAKKEVPKLIEAGVRCFEQLFHRDDKESYDKAYKEWGKDCELIVDESLTDEASLHRLLNERNIHGACLKIAKNGGLVESMKIAKVLTENDLSVRLGCHVGETSYLSLLGLVFGTLIDIKDIEGGLSPILLDHDPFLPNIAFGAGGKINVTEQFRSKFGANIVFQFDQ